MKILVAEREVNDLLRLFTHQWILGRREVKSVQESDLSLNFMLNPPVVAFDLSAPKGLFPPEPEKYNGPKLKVAIIGCGLAGMSTAVELLDQGHEVGNMF